MKEEQVTEALIREGKLRAAIATNSTFTITPRSRWARREIRIICGAPRGRMREGNTRDMYFLFAKGGYERGTDGVLRKCMVTSVGTYDEDEFIKRVLPTIKEIHIQSPR